METMENIYDNLIHLYEDKVPNMFERAFVIMLMGHITFDAKPATPPEIWQDAEIAAREQDNRIPAADAGGSEKGGMALAAYSVRYLAENLSKAEILEILNAALKDKSDEPLKIFRAFGAKFGKSHIFGVFLAQHKKKVSKFDPKTFKDLFKYPCWLEFTPEAEAKIQAAILNGELSDEEIDYYLGVSERHEGYVKLYPVVRHVIKTTQNAHLLWTAGDVLNLIWTTLPDEPEIQKWFRREIYDMFWPRIGSAWPIIHHDNIDIRDDDERQMFNDTYGWLTSLKDLGEINPDLKDVPVRVYDKDPEKRGDLDEFLATIIESGENASPEDLDLDVDDARVAEMLERYHEIAAVCMENSDDPMRELTNFYRVLCYSVTNLSDTAALERLGEMIKETAGKLEKGKAGARQAETIDELTSFAKNEFAEYRREQEDLRENLIRYAGEVG